MSPSKIKINASPWTGGAGSHCRLHKLNAVSNTCQFYHCALTLLFLQDYSSIKTLSLLFFCCKLVDFLQNSGWKTGTWLKRTLKSSYVIWLIIYLSAISSPRHADVNLRRLAYFLHTFAELLLSFCFINEINYSANKLSHSVWRQSEKCGLEDFKNRQNCSNTSMTNMSQCAMLKCSILW